MGEYEDLTSGIEKLKLEIERENRNTTAIGRECDHITSQISMQKAINEQLRIRTRDMNGWAQELEEMLRRLQSAR